MNFSFLPTEVQHVVDALDLLRQDYERKANTWQYGAEAAVYRRKASECMSLRRQLLNKSHGQPRSNGGGPNGHD